MRRVTGLVAGLPGCSVVNFAEKTQVLLTGFASLSLPLLSKTGANLAAHAVNEDFACPKMEF
jgi:hypothetical protein